MPFRPVRPTSSGARLVSAVRRWRPGRGSRGQSMVEFTLVLPIMLFLMAIAVDFGRLFYAYVAVENAAKEGALYGSRNPLCVDISIACPDPINVRWHVENEATNLRSGGASLLDSQIACRAPNGTLRQPINDCVNGDTYIVSVSYDFDLITPILSSVISNGMTLASTSEAKVIGDAFDPSGLEALIWANTSNSDNAATITTQCTPADAASSPGYYYAPCQNSQNVNEYLQFPEDKTISFKVRIKNTGNIALTNLTYAYEVDGTTITTPPGCSGGSSLATSLARNAGPSYCSFTLPATVSGTGITDLNVSITAQGLASGVATGSTSGGATVKVIPRPKFVVNLRASAYRLGGDGNGLNGVASYPTGDLTLGRQPGGSSEFSNPTGWLLLTVRNTGGPADSFAASITRNGTAIALPADCVVPSTLDTGDSFACVVPEPFNGGVGTATFFGNATATNSQIVGGQQTVRVITQDCALPKQTVPNLVDTLSPSANRTNKTLADAESAWAASLVGGSLVATPALPTTNFVVDQDTRAYSCVNANTNVKVSTQVTQP